MTRKTALHQVQQDLAASFAEVSGVLLPANYGSMLTEHTAVRESAGMFDLSNHCLMDLQGEAVETWLRRMLSNDVAKLADGQGMYTCLCRDDAGVIDHFLISRISAVRYVALLDQSRQHNVLGWLEQHKVPGVTISVNEENATLAVQGPDAVSLTQMALREMGLPLDVLSLPPCHAIESGNWFVSRSGDSGEDGVQINLPAAQATPLWQVLASHEVAPAGVDAYDTLRIEAGYSAYGYDIDAQHSPVEAGLAATIDIKDDDRDFIGREILEDHKLFGGRVHQIGLVLDIEADLRAGLAVERVGQPIGEITSATFSPTRGTSIALARVDKLFQGGCDVHAQGRFLPAHIASIPFVPHGHARE